MKHTEKYVIIMFPKSYKRSGIYEKTVICEYG